MAQSVRQAQKQLNSIDNRLNVAREYTRLWQQYFQFFSEGFEDKKIYDKDEQAFFQLMHVLAMNHYRFTGLTGEFFKDGEAILKVLSETVSLNSIKLMSDAQFSKLLIDWHTLFLAMNKAIGKLMQQLPPPAEPKAKKK